MKKDQFIWLECKTIQCIYVLQLTAEFIEMINKKFQPTPVKRPEWALPSENKDFKWNFLDVFRKKSKKELYACFDGIEDLSSDEEGDWSCSSSKRSDSSFENSIKKNKKLTKETLPSINRSDISGKFQLFYDGNV